MKLETGDVVWHEAPFKSPRADGSRPDRPWLIVSNESHPFHGTEYVVLGMTTTTRSEGIRVHQSDWRDGGTSRTSFVSPWFVMTLKHADIGYRVGAVTESIVEDAVEDLTAHLGF